MEVKQVQTITFSEAEVHTIKSMLDIIHGVCNGMGDDCNEKCPFYKICQANIGVLLEKIISDKQVII